MVTFIKGPAVTGATVDLCRQYIDSGRVDVIQVGYSILRQLTGEIFDYAYDKGVGVVVRTSIESGFWPSGFLSLLFMVSGEPFSAPTETGASSQKA